MGTVCKREMRLPPVLICQGLALAACMWGAQGRLITGADLLPSKQSGRRQTTDDSIPLWYPGRPTGICTSRGHTCTSIILNKPFHVENDGECKSSLPKTMRDRYGRPLTIRYTYRKQVYIANREQVCDYNGHKFSSNRTFIAEHIDDYIWKNLSIWARDGQALWAEPAQKVTYLKCHELFASYHCSSMYPNCTAEFLDQKPAPPCRELCEELIEWCSWGTPYTGQTFLPYEPVCTNYPSANDPYKQCTRMGVEPAYMYRVASAPLRKALDPTKMAVIALIVLGTVYSTGP